MPAGSCRARVRPPRPCHTASNNPRYPLVSYTFTTCGYYNHLLGPSQKDCDESYREAAAAAGGGAVVQPTQVLIGDDMKSKDQPHEVGHTTGIQRWTVPRTDLYT